MGFLPQENKREASVVSDHYSDKTFREIYFTPSDKPYKPQRRRSRSSSSDEGNSPVGAVREATVESQGVGACCARARSPQKRASTDWCHHEDGSMCEHQRDAGDTVCTETSRRGGGEGSGAEPS